VLKKNTRGVKNLQVVSRKMHPQIEDGVSPTLGTLKSGSTVKKTVKIRVKSAVKKQPILYSE